MTPHFSFLGFLKIFIMATLVNKKHFSFKIEELNFINEFIIYPVNGS